MEARMLTLAAALAAVALAGVVGVPAAAAAPTVLVDSTGHPAYPAYQRWVDRSLVPTPPGTVTIHRAECPGNADAFACTLAGTREVYLARPSRWALMHELGHVFDYTVLTDVDRARFLRLRHMAGRAWRSPPDSPHEQLAEGYRICSTYRRPPLFDGRVNGGYDYMPTPAVHRRVCALISHAP